MAEKISSTLAQKAMIVTLSASCWSGRMADKEATQELLASKAAAKTAGSFIKVLVDKKHLKDVRMAINSMRDYHNNQTMPWDNNGGRLLPSSKYSQYTMKLRELQRELEAAVTIFVKNYDDYVTESSIALGDLFDKEEYPFAADLGTKFFLDSEFSKINEAADFRVDIPEEDREEIKKQIESKVETKHADSMEKLWKRIYVAVEHMTEKLIDEKGIFRDSMIENIKQLVSVLPALNILDDPELADMTTELKDGLCGYTAKELRTDKVLRKDVATKSTELMSQIEKIYKKS